VVVPCRVEPEVRDSVSGGAGQLVVDCVCSPTELRLRLLRTISCRGLEVAGKSSRGSQHQRYGCGKDCNFVTHDISPISGYKCICTYLNAIKRLMDDRYANHQVTRARAKSSRRRRAASLEPIVASNSCWALVHSASAFFRRRSPAADSENT